MLLTKVENVTWIEGEVVTTRALDGLNQFLVPFKSQYKFSPKCRQATISVLQLKDAGRKRVGSELRKFRSSGAIDPRGKIRIRSSPFVSVNPAMFIGYASEGTISFTARDRSAMLCDIRYLEGMHGGLATDKDDYSLGIVVGSLKKTNGEGEFTVVAPWTEIIKAVDLATSNVRHIRSIRPADSMAVVPEKDYLPAKFHGVVALTVSRPGRGSIWGSGVLLDPETVVTNAHVVEPHLSITAWFTKTEKRTAQLVAVPFKDIDLAFLKLQTPASSEFPPVKFQSNPTIRPHDPVVSVGYGMIYPHSMHELQPIQSTGIISKVVQMDSSPVLLITSAGCWNGSSGGALFDPNMNLIGLMSSNGKMDDTGEIIPTMSFILPIQIIAKARSLVKQGSQASLDPRISKLWKLQPTHDIKL
ncbi:hypothetical protein TRICI_000699 [Trichomonascus ciferrii]|uniref:Serine protease n=1 Tax=Trichomonascus ciferrii TaxID=44093 RepID=A0A642VBF5_9ASCO|nr:hypothetical protein TRICI_000699 [Trichomonascus ciferrii]